jgi:DNA (cytosine-5)-methyltransferase 1
VDKTPTHVDLFSGIGGFALAAKWAGFRTIAFCEIDKYCQKVLAKNFCHSFSERCDSGRIRDRGKADEERERAAISRSVQMFSNIFDFDGTRYRGCDLLTGGFPCQPFSVAGKRRGAADERAIWPEMFRVIKEARPAWILGENVPGIIPMELDNVLSDLESIGYTCWPFVIPACAVDAKHRRDRVWIIGRYMGDTGRSGLEGHGHIEVSDSQGWQEESGHIGATSGCGSMADTRLISEGRSPGRTETDRRRSHIELAGCCRWEPESRLGRMANELSDWLDGPYCTFPPEPSVPRIAKGVKNRVDRLKGLGNSIVPSVAYEILREIRNLI